MSELTKFEIFVCMLYHSQNEKKINVCDAKSFRSNVLTLLHSPYVYSVDDFCDELRKLYFGCDLRLYSFVVKFIKRIKKMQLYIS